MNTVQLTVTLGPNLAIALNDQMKAAELPLVFKPEMAISSYLRAIGMLLAIRGGVLTAQQENELKLELNPVEAA